MIYWMTLLLAAFVALFMPSIGPHVGFIGLIFIIGLVGECIVVELRKR